MKYIGFLFLCLFVSCQTKSSYKISDVKIEHCADFPSKKFVSCDTLFVWDEYMPRELGVINDLLCVTMSKSDTCIHLHDKNSGKLVSKVGTIGQGPEDMLSPKLVKNGFEMGGEGLMLYDMNAKRQFFLDGKGDLNNFSALDDSYTDMGSLNVGKTRAVGQLLKGEPSLFSIVENESEIVIPLSPSLPDSYKEKMKGALGYLYGSHIVCNNELERVVAGMYFFDVIQIYNLKGDCIKMFSLDSKYDVVENFKKMIEGDDYWGFSQSYATDKYCYLRRDLNNEKTSEKKKSQIVQIDWNGNVVKVIELPSNVTGGFCIDGDKKIYYIVHSLTDNDELYILLSNEIG